MRSYNATSKQICTNWYGNTSGGIENNSYVEPGLYQVTLNYGSGKSAQRTVAVFPSAAQYVPRLTHLKTLKDTENLNDFGVELAIDEEITAAASSFIITGEYSVLHIEAQLGESLSYVLDGEGPNPPQLSPAPYDDAYWAVEFKSSMMFPQLEDIQAAGGDKQKIYENLTTRDNWHMLK